MIKVKIDDKGLQNLLKQLNYKKNTKTLCRSLNGILLDAVEENFARECFNPRSRVGSDNDASNCFVVSESFNPRSRVGSDSFFIAILATHLSFNPRSRVGSDVDNPNAEYAISVSIHAPAWGATEGKIWMIL